MPKSLAAVLLAAILAASPVLASNKDSKAGAAPKDADRKSSADHTAQPKEQRPEDNLDTCKRDADGMKGPERSRFMTECLRQRR